MNQILIFAIPYFILGMALELFHSHRKNEKKYQYKDMAASLSMGIGNLIVGALTASFKVATLVLVHSYAPIDLGNAWYIWILAIIGVDFFAYFDHRMGHESRFFWASHVVHHSSTNYNLGTALRQTWTGKPISTIFYLPLAFIGISPEIILAAMAINLLYQFWVHTEYIGKLGWFEKVFNTPSHHRVHHSSEPLYIDKNYGGIFILWDRMFGTFQEEVSKPTYGLVENIKSYNPFYIAFHEWGALFHDAFQARGILNKLKVMFASPLTAKNVMLKQKYEPKDMNITMPLKKAA